MEKKCSFQKTRKWTLAPNPTRKAFYPFRQGKLDMKTILLASLVILLVHSSTHVCLAQSKTENGPDAGVNPGKARPVRSSNYATQCMPQEYVGPVYVTFKKLIPSFDSRSITILLKSDNRVQLGPGDAPLVPFLTRYYTTALQQIASIQSSYSQQDENLFTTMYLYFNREYARFLTRFGVPLSCIALFLGVTNAQAVVELQALTTALQRQYLPEGSRNVKCLFAQDMTGEQILNALNVKTDEVYAPSKYLQDYSRDESTCEQIIFYLRDGSLMARLPSLNVNRQELDIPYLVSPIPIGKVGVPYQIGRYLAIGLGCLDDDIQRGNFTGKVVDWMTSNVLYDIVQAPVCPSGFGGILPFIVSVQHFVDNLSGRRRDILPIPKVPYYDYSEPVIAPRPSFNSIQRIFNAKEGNADKSGYPVPPVPVVVDPDAPETTESKEERRRESTWSFIVFILLILILLGLIYYYLMFGPDVQTVIWYLRKFVMYMKERETKVSNRVQPKYTRLEESETDESSAIAEVTGPTVFSTPTSSTEDDSQPPPPPPPPPPPRSIQGLKRSPRSIQKPPPPPKKENHTSAKIDNSSPKPITTPPGIVVTPSKAQNNSSKRISTPSEVDSTSFLNPSAPDLAASEEQPTSSSEESQYPLGKLQLPPPPRVVKTPSSKPSVIRVVPPVENSGSPKISNYHRHRHRHHSHSSKAPLVAIHASGNETIKLEFTTDMEDGYCTSVQVDEEYSDEDGNSPRYQPKKCCVCTECEFAEDDSVSTTDKNSVVSAPVLSRPNQAKGKVEERPKPKTIHYYDDTYFDTVSSLSGLSPEEERNIYDRYTGNTTQDAYEKFH